MIAEKCISDYKQRFKSMHNNARALLNLGSLKLIPDLDNNELIKLPNLEQIKNPLFSIDSNNTPGPDGFGVGFLKNYWQIIKNGLFNCILEFMIIKNGLFNCILEFFINGKIPEEITIPLLSLS